MPSRNPALVSVDTAYAGAEALLDDEAARTARRARVLGAVDNRGEANPRQPSASPQPRRSWRGGRWLAAAGVAGLATFVALRLDSPSKVELRSSATDSRAAPIDASSVEAAAQEVPASPVSPAPTPVAVAPETVAGAQARASDDMVAGGSTRPPVEAAALPALSAAAVAMAEDENTSEVVVTGGRAPPAPPAPPSARARAAPSAAIVGATTAATSVSAAGLHAAAAAGRLDELTRLLDRGAPIDTPDAAGETALMKSIEANRPVAAALLRRRGASLDQTNEAGLSAREMAAAINDPELNRALGLP